MGDWGEDTAAQRQVSLKMSAAAKSLRSPLSAVVLCGDSFYFALAGPQDPRWKTLFEDMYDRSAGQCSLLLCLGNHDYQANNFAAEFAYALRAPAISLQAPGAGIGRILPLTALWSLC